MPDPTLRSGGIGHHLQELGLVWQIGGLFVAFYGTCIHDAEMVIKQLPLRDGIIQGSPPWNALGLWGRGNFQIFHRFISCSPWDVDPTSWIFSYYSPRVDLRKQAALTENFPSLNCPNGVDDGFNVAASHHLSRQGSCSLGSVRSYGCGVLTSPVCMSRTSQDSRMLSLDPCSGHCAPRGPEWLDPAPEPSRPR